MHSRHDGGTNKLKFTLLNEGVFFYLLHHHLGELQRGSLGEVRLENERERDRETDENYSLSQKPRLEKSACFCVLLKRKRGERASFARRPRVHL